MGRSPVSEFVGSARVRSLRVHSSIPTTAVRRSPVVERGWPSPTNPSPPTTTRPGSRCRGTESASSSNSRSRTRASTGGVPGTFAWVRAIRVLWSISPRVARAVRFRTRFRPSRWPGGYRTESALESPSSPPRRTARPKINFQTLTQGYDTKAKAPVLLPAPYRYLLLGQHSTLLFPTVAVGVAITRHIRVGVGFISGIGVIDSTSASVSSLGSKDAGGDHMSEDSLGTLRTQDLFVPGVVVSAHVSFSPNIDVAVWGRYLDSVRTTTGVLDVTQQPFDGNGGLNPPCAGEPGPMGTTYGRCSAKQSVPNHLTNALTRFEYPIPPEIRLALRFHQPRTRSRAEFDANRQMRDPLREDLFDIEFDPTVSLNSLADTIRVRFAERDGAGTVLTNPTNVPVPPNADRPTGYRDSFGVRVGGQWNAVRDLLGLRAGGWFESHSQDPALLTVAPVGATGYGIGGGVVVRYQFMDVSVGYQRHLSLGLDNHGDGRFRATAAVGTTAFDERREPPGVSAAESHGVSHGPCGQRGERQLRRARVHDRNRGATLNKKQEGTMQSSKESRWVLAMGCVVLAFTGCEGGVSQPPLETAGAGGASVNPQVETGGAMGAALGQARCQGACCPTAAECFPLGNPSAHSGAECLAQRDNTGQKHWQFRQTLSVSTEPPGTAVASIANVLVTASDLPWPACSSSTGTSGFIQLIDIDTEHDTARFGFATYVTDVPAAVRDGLCMVEDSYADVPESVLPAIAGRPDGWPDGMPLPLRLPFAVKPTLGVRYKDQASGALRDFDLATERADILKRLDKDTGDLKEYDGIYFLDEARGYLHGYSPLAFISNYC